jgi:glycosyltransferase involved in cell wall biosynthesis
VNGAHVCVVTTSHDAKDYRIYHKQALSLARAGYRVSLIAPSKAGEDAAPVELIPLPPARSRWARYVTGPFRAWRAARRTGADLFHIHDPELLWVGLALKVLRKKVIFDAHENYLEKLQAKTLPRLLKLPAIALWQLWSTAATKHFDHVLAADADVREAFTHCPCTVVANYVPSSFGQIEVDRSHDGVFRIMYVGCVATERGIGKLLEAIDLLPLAALELHVAGSSKSASLCAAITAHARSKYYGVLRWEDVSRLLAKGDVGTLLLQPVCGYQNITGEGCLKLFEYMAMGLPVVAANFPKLKQFIDRIGCGVTVDPTSPTEIARAIEYLHGNPAVCREMGENGRHAVRDRYNWEEEEKKLLNVYQVVLERSQ